MKTYKKITDLIGNTPLLKLTNYEKKNELSATILAKRPENKGKVIVTLLPDTGDRYLSTPMFSE